MDVNFKQSMKGVANALPALRPGGTIRAFLRAERGLEDIVLPEKGLPLKLLKRLLRLLGASRVMCFLERVKPGLNVEEKFLLYYTLQLVRAYDPYVYTPSQTTEQVKRLGFFEGFDRPEKALEKGRSSLPNKAVVAVFSEAGSTFPVRN